MVQRKAVHWKEKVKLHSQVPVAGGGEWAVKGRERHTVQRTSSLSCGKRESGQACM